MESEQNIIQESEIEEKIDLNDNETYDNIEEYEDDEEEDYNDENGDNNNDDYDDDQMNEEEADKADMELEENVTTFQDDSVMSYFGHNQQPVYSVAFHPNSNEMIATAGGDDICHVWDRLSGQAHGTLTGHSDSVVDVSFSFDGRYLATASLDSHIKIWDPMAEGKLVNDLEASDEINWINWHPKGHVLIAGCKDGSIWMWNIPSGTVMQVFSGTHISSLSCGKFTNDGKNLVSACDEGILAYWDPKSASVITKFTPKDDRFHQDAILTLDTHQDNVVVATGSADNTGRLVHLSSKKILGTFENHSDSVESVEFSPLLAMFASAGLDGKLNIWDSNTLQLRQSSSHDDGIIKLAWFKSAPIVATASLDATIRIWDARNGACVKTFHGHQDALLDFAISPDEKFIATGSDDGSSLIFQML